MYKNFFTDDEQTKLLMTNSGVISLEKAAQEIGETKYYDAAKKNMIT